MAVVYARLYGACSECTNLCSVKPFDAPQCNPDAVAMEDTAARTPTLAALTWVMLRDANSTFGGGTASSEVLRRSLVKRGWMTNDDHRELYALSRLTPGTNLLAYCTAVGWRTRGAQGAIASWLAASIPCSLIALAATVLFDQASESRVLGFVLLVGMSVALVLLAMSAWHLAEPQLTLGAARRTAAVGAIALGLTIFGVSPLSVLLISAAVGGLWP